MRIDFYDRFGINDTLAYSLTQSVGADRQTTVQGNDKLSVEKEQLLSIEENQTNNYEAQSIELINKNKLTFIEQDMIEEIKGYVTSYTDHSSQQKVLQDLYVNIAQEMGIEVTNAYDLKANTIKETADTIELNCDEGISLKCGSTVFTLDGSGLHTNGVIDTASSNKGIEAKRVSVPHSQKIFEHALSYKKLPDPIIYEVKPHDTLSDIAKLYNLSYKEIAQANAIETPYTIYPQQTLIIPTNQTQKPKKEKIQGKTIALGAKVHIHTKGTPHAKATLHVLADKKPFKVIHKGQEKSKISIKLDEHGQCDTEVTLRPKDDAAYKQLIKEFSPQVGKDIVKKSLTIKSVITEKDGKVVFEKDDKNNISLHIYQTYIKAAYLVDKNNGKITQRLTVVKQESEIHFHDNRGESVAKTTPQSLTDAIENDLGNVNNGLGGLAAGMEYKKGTFALTNTQGVYLKHYESNWHGNQYVKTYDMARWGKGLSQGTLAISVVLGLVQVASAESKDEAYLDENNITKADIAPDFGEEAEQKTGNFLGGLAGGAATTFIALFFLPEEAAFLLTLGTFVVAGAVVGWVSSQLGERAVKLEQRREGHTIVHDYPLGKK